MDPFSPDFSLNEDYTRLSSEVATSSRPSPQFNYDGITSLVDNFAGGRASPPPASTPPPAFDATRFDADIRSISPSLAGRNKGNVVNDPMFTIDSRGNFNLNLGMATDIPNTEMHAVVQRARDEGMRVVSTPPAPAERERGMLGGMFDDMSGHERALIFLSTAALMYQFYSDRERTKREMTLYRDSVERAERHRAEDRGFAQSMSERQHAQIMERQGADHGRGGGAVTRASSEQYR